MFITLGELAEVTGTSNRAWHHFAAMTSKERGFQYIQGYHNSLDWRKRACLLEDIEKVILDAPLISYDDAILKEGIRPHQLLRGKPRREFYSYNHIKDSHDIHKNPFLATELTHDIGTD